MLLKKYWKQWECQEINFLNWLSAYDPLFLMELLLPITDPSVLKFEMSCCMYYLKDTGSIWMTANTIGIHQSIFSKLIVEVCPAIIYNVGPQFVHFLIVMSRWKRNYEKLKWNLVCLKLLGLSMWLISPYLHLENL